MLHACGRWYDDNAVSFFVKVRAQDERWVDETDREAMEQHVACCAVEKEAGPACLMISFGGLQKRRGGGEEVG